MRRSERTTHEETTPTAADSCTAMLTCPRCGLTAEGIRCPRCNALKLTACSGVCSSCGSGCATKGGK
jgi:rubrerythrin